MKAMQKKRLQTLINVMQRVVDTEGAFDLWGWQNASGDLHINTQTTEKRLHKCGATACVAGWLAVSPEFKKAGGSVSAVGSPRLKEYGEFEAFALYLKCPYNQASLIASPARSLAFYGRRANEVTAKIVVARLTQLLETGE